VVGFNGFVRSLSIYS